MQDGDRHVLRQAVDALVAAVAALDLTDASPDAGRDLWALGDRLEEVGRTAAARIADPSAGTAAVEDGSDRLSHPLRRVES
jgi:hypothetical protein